jgi:class 3 adenylate cyclase
MAHPERRRRLAAILFLDIVGSTEVATKVGDGRWRELLGQFRSLVRDEVKRHKGREEDTAGDGFFATFAQPAAAVRAAAEIVHRVQEVGLDVRCGVHFGETEAIERHRGGVAAHIGSRVMSLAGSSEVLLTGTVRDLMVGAKVELEDGGIHELKGVPGSWQVWRLRSLDGRQLPEPLDPVAADAVRAQAQEAGRQRRDRILLAGGIAVLLLLGGAAVVLSRQPSGTLPPAANPSASPGIVVVKMDPLTNLVTKQIRDPYRSIHTDTLRAVNGALWQVVSNDALVGLARRDMDSGQVLDTLAMPQEPQAAYGFGSAWVAGESGKGVIDRWDAATKRKTGSITVPNWVWAVEGGPTAIWVIVEGWTLAKIDPITTAVVATYHVPIDSPYRILALKNRVWLSAGDSGELVEFDPATGKFLRTLRTGHRGYLVGITSGPSGDILWVLDDAAGTLTPIDSKTATAGQPIGVGVNAHTATVGLNSVWVAAGNEVLRLRGTLADMIVRIKMPAGFSAGSIAVDATTNSIWVGDCRCRIK